MTFEVIIFLGDSPCSIRKFCILELVVGGGIFYVDKLKVAKRTTFVCYLADAAKIYIYIYIYLGLPWIKVDLLAPGRRYGRLRRLLRMVIDS